MRDRQQEQHSHTSNPPNANRCYTPSHSSHRTHRQDHNGAARATPPQEETAGTGDARNESTRDAPGELGMGWAGERVEGESKRERRIASSAQGELPPRAEHDQRCVVTSGQRRLDRARSDAEGTAGEGAFPPPPRGAAGLPRVSDPVAAERRTQAQGRRSRAVIDRRWKIWKGAQSARRR